MFNPHQFLVGFFVLWFNCCDKFDKVFDFRIDHFTIILFWSLLNLIYHGSYLKQVHLFIFFVCMVAFNLCTFVYQNIQYCLNIPYLEHGYRDKFPVNNLLNTNYFPFYLMILFKYYLIIKSIFCNPITWLFFYLAPIFD